MVYFLCKEYGHSIATAFANTLLQVYHLTLQLKEWLAENLVQFWGDLSSLEYPTRSKVRKVSAEVYSYDSDSDLTNNVHMASTADSEATSSTARLSEEDNQPV